MRPLATLLCVAFVAFLFWRDQSRKDADRISWAPFFWMCIAGSRFVSGWLDLRGPGTVDAYTEGSPVDRVVFFSLIVWGVIVLSRRNLDWRQVMTQNRWLVAYFLYCLASVAWTAEPGILAKRWAKDLGNPIMALVLLTERRPYDAIVTTLRRLGFFLLPVSVLLIRYIPELGRGYAADGTPMYSGVADQKNTLGLSCLIVGICYFSTFVRTRRLADRYDLVTGAMLAWLLYMANSKTSLTCLFVAMIILACSAHTAIVRRPARLIAVVACGAVLYVAADALFQVQGQLLALLGRSPTLTNRTDVWAILRTFQTNELVGTGFMSFWTGERMAAIWTAVGSRINQAHNGYLEQYLNLGYVGVAFILAIALSALASVRRHFRSDYAVAVLRLCFLAIALLYNYTEASFYGINNMWVLFLAAAITPTSLGASRILSTQMTQAGPTTSRGVYRRRRAVVAARHSGQAQEFKSPRPPGRRTSSVRNARRVPGE
jgi:hypothetical protein